MRDHPGIGPRDCDVTVRALSAIAPGPSRMPGTTGHATRHVGCDRWSTASRRVDALPDGRVATDRVRVGFVAPPPAAVAAWCPVAMAAAVRGNDVSGRQAHHPAVDDVAFVVDADGHSIHAVRHRPEASH